jgi:DNA-binding transcriptional regulator YhcF (GntR family)
MSVNTDSPRPPYMQVANKLQSDILDGRLKPGDKLPSIRDLAERFGVSAMTVQSALRVLRVMELITSQQGRGTYVRTDLKKVLKRLKDEAFDPTDQLYFERQMRTMQAFIEELIDRVETLEREVAALKATVKILEG